MPGIHGVHAVALLPLAFNLKVSANLDIASKIFETNGEPLAVCSLRVRDHAVPKGYRLTLPCLC